MSDWKTPICGAVIPRLLSSSSSAGRDFLHPPNQYDGYSQREKNKKIKKKHLKKIRASDDV